MQQLNQVSENAGLTRKKKEELEQAAAACARKGHHTLRKRLEDISPAEVGGGVDVLRAVANEGPRAKRIRPAPMGRAYRYQRRTSHIVVKVGERE